MTTALEISLTGANITYEVNLEDGAPHEIEFFERALSLLEGWIIHKWFGNISSINKETYNPLLQNNHPKKKGFGERQIRLNQSLNQLEFWQLNSSRIEMTLNVDELFKIVLPNLTQEIVQV